MKFSFEPEANKACEWLKAFVDLNVTQDVHSVLFAYREISFVL